MPGRYGEKANAPPVPMGEWVVERPFDSADFLDGEPPRYQRDGGKSAPKQRPPKGGGGSKVVEAAVQTLQEALPPEVMARKMRPGIKTKQRGRTGSSDASEFNKKHSRTAKGRVGGGEFRKESEGERSQQPGAPRSRKDVELELERQIADANKPKGGKRKGEVSEDDPNFNWRTMGNGIRGVKLKSGERVNVNGPQFDKLKREGQLAPDNPTLRGDSPDSGNGGGTKASGSSGGPRSRSGGSGRSKAGKDTWQGDLSSGPALRRGTGMAERGDGSPKRKRGDGQVRQLQSKLEALGYDLGDGGVDGRYGPATEKAVKALQRDLGLKADGVVGNRTRRILNLLGKREQRGDNKGGLSLDQAKLSEAQIAAAVATIEALEQ